MSLYVLPKEKDVHYAFRSRFTVQGANKQIVSFKLSGIHQFVIYIDGEFCGDGPSRFSSNNVQYTEYPFELNSGEHIIAIIMQYYDITTRIMDNKLPPFLFCECEDENKNVVSMDFKYSRLSGYDSGKNIKIADTLGMMEWCDNNLNPQNWIDVNFDDSHWTTLVLSQDFEVSADTTRPVRKVESVLEDTNHGFLTEDFGYEADFVPVRFFLRRLEKLINPPQGVWKRYDLGYIKLGRPCFVLDLPKGATVEIAVCEELQHDRVSPFISLTGGPSCNMIHFTAAGGIETFMPLTPLGGRFIELHIVCLPEDVKSVKILSEIYYWRTFFDEPIGKFECDDSILPKIWTLGINTLRSCTEDVVTDCPIRERGQWIGDCSVAGLRTTANGYGDMQVIRKSLIQATYCCDENGVLPALFPGQTGFFITYSIQWICGCMDYFKYTNDRVLLVKIYDAAIRFVNYLNLHFNLSDGIFRSDEGKVLDCGFVDWGYAVNNAEMTAPLVCMYHEGLLNLIQIQKTLGFDNADLICQAEKVMSTLVVYIDGKRAADRSINWSAFGYHGAVMLLKVGAILPNEKTQCIDYIKEFALSCFPNNLDAPRLYSPTIFLDKIITPYFYNYTLWAFMENGEELFVYDQIKKCWGYMLELGETTCLEVFDTRWSHCHQWSACPTWILSSYCLGLHKSFDLGLNHFTFKLIPGDLQSANGVVPLADGGKIEISWSINKGALEYRACADRDIVVHMPNGSTQSCKKGEGFTI